MSSSLLISVIAEDDSDAVASLWQRCGLTRPWNDTRSDIARAVRGGSSDILVGRQDGRIVATAMVGHDGHRGWVYYLATDPGLRQRGYGRTMMAAAESWLRDRAIEKLMLMVRPDNEAVHAFYRSLGFESQTRTVFARWLDGRAITP